MKKKLGCALVLVCTILINILIFVKGSYLVKENVQFHVTLEMEQPADVQLLYSDGIFDLDHVDTKRYQKGGMKQELVFNIPSQYQAWRLDYGNVSGRISVSDMYVSLGEDKVTIPQKAVMMGQNHDVNMEAGDDLNYAAVVYGEDPYTIFAMDEIGFRSALNEQAKGKTIVVKTLICVCLDLMVLYLLFGKNYFLDLCYLVYRDRRLIFNLAKNDFKTRYVGSYLGAVWAFIRPIITIMVYWFVFQVGLHSTDVDGFPFVLWLIAGLVPWFYFQEALSGGTNALIEYQYLVKKIVFNVSALPIVKIVSALFVHVVFMIFTVVIYAANGHLPDLYTLQLVYYSFCAAVLILALTYVTSALVIFFRDMNQIIGVILEVGVWITPIMWKLSAIPQQFVWIFKLNPMYYVVNGYRESLIAKTGFWNNLYGTSYFWIVTILLFIVGMNVFNKLKVHFADVL